MREAGASPEQIRRFIDTAVVESEQATVPERKDSLALGPLAIETAATALEVGGALAGGMRYGMRGGATGGLGGNILAQALRTATGQQPEGVSTKQAISSALWGALQPPMARTPESTLQYLADLGKTGVTMGGAGATIEAAGTLAEEGRLPTAGEMVVPTAIPAALGMSGQAIQRYGGSIMRSANEAGGNLLKFLRAGIESVTPGQLMPTKYGGYEYRRIRDIPGGETAERAQKTFDKLADGLSGISTGLPPAEPATVFEGLKRRVESGRLEEQIATLGKTAQDAQNAVTTAQRIVQNVGATADTRILAEGRRVANEALDTAKEAALDRARQLSVKSMTGEAAMMNPAEAYESFRMQVFEPLQAAHKKHFDNLYGFFPSTEPVFDSAPIRKAILAASDDTFEKLPTRVREILSSDNISLNALNQVKAELRERGNYGSFSPSALEAGFRRANRALSVEAEAQADKAFGPSIGNQYRAVSEDYRKFSDIMDSPGMAPFQARDFREAPVQELVDSLKESGVKSTKFVEVMDAINNLAAPQKTKVMYQIGLEPSMTSGQQAATLVTETPSIVDRQLAESLKGHLFTMIRGNIINQATDDFGRIDPNKIVGILGSIGRNKGSLETLGLGSLGQVQELATLVKQYPSADKMTAADWNALWSSPSFKKAFESGETMASLIRVPLQQAEIKDLTMRAVFAEQIGKKTLAEEKLAQAMKAAGEDAAMRAQVQAQYDTFKQDPLFSVFNKGRGEALSTESYNALKSTLFDPNSSRPIHSTYVREIMSGFENSPNISDKQIAQSLKTDYLTSYLSQLERVGPYQRTTTDKLASMVNPKTASEKNEIIRARAILGDDQYLKLRQVAEAAEVLNRYDAYGRSGIPKDEAKSVAGMVKRGYYAIADLIRDGAYDRAAQAILEPGFENKLMLKGQLIERTGAAIKAAAGPLTEQVLRYREEIQRPEGQQGPASLGRFMAQEMRRGAVPPSVMQFAPLR